MNRTILILICDFLLVSLLAFSTVDINQVTENTTARLSEKRPELATNRTDSTKDLAVVMRMALDDERKERDKLLGELTRTRENLGQQQAKVVETEQKVQQFQKDLAAREEQAQRLRQEQAGLQQQLATTRTNISQLETRLKTTSDEAAKLRQESSQQAAAQAAELKRRTDEAAALQRRLDDLSRSNQLALDEKQKLAAQLQVAEVEKRYAAEQMNRMQEQVKVEREEKAKLAEGVQALAARSGKLEQEIRENRPLNPNTIFSMMVSNRVRATFDAERPNLLGIDSTKRRATATVLVSSGTNVYAVAHVSDTPFTFFSPGTDWHSLVGQLARHNAAVPIQAMSFHGTDPRIVLIPLTSGDAEKLGVKPYRTTTDPFKFADAVIVGAQEGYYGEARFEIDLTTPGYVKLDRGFLKALFGQFNPSRGDLVFSKSGELLGIMANNSYCLVLKEFPTIATFQFAADTRAQKTGTTLSYLYSKVLGMPAKLQ